MNRKFLTRTEIITVFWLLLQKWEKICRYMCKHFTDLKVQHYHINPEDEIIIFVPP